MNINSKKENIGFYNPGFYPNPQNNTFSPAILYLKNSVVNVALSKYKLDFAMIKYEIQSIDRDKMLEQSFIDYENALDACDKGEQTFPEVNLFKNQLKKLGYSLMPKPKNIPEELEFYWVLGMTKFIFER